MEQSTSEKKRDNYLCWTDYFMAVAYLAAQRSKDPVCQVGACIVNKENKIMGIGYNGMPNGCHDDDFPWGKTAQDENDSKKFYVCHAEMNAIINKNAADVKDCKIFVSLFPCNECAKLIIQSGIKEVYYLSDEKNAKPRYQASRRMFDAAGVKCCKYEPQVNEIVINFQSKSGLSNSMAEEMDNMKINESL